MLGRRYWRPWEHDLNDAVRVIDDVVEPLQVEGQVNALSACGDFAVSACGSLLCVEGLPRSEASLAVLRAVIKLLQVLQNTSWSSYCYYSDDSYCCF